MFSYANLKASNYFKKRIYLKTKNADHLLTINYCQKQFDLKYPDGTGSVKSEYIKCINLRETTHFE